MRAGAGTGRQKGATLVVALVMLAAMSLLAASSLTSSSMNLRIVGNMQARSEARHAAQQAIETVISTPRFVATPGDAVPEPCGERNTLCTDLDGDGAPEYITRLVPAPTCVAVRVLKVSELNLASAEDLSCLAGQARRAGSASSDSLCARTAWDITAETRATFSRTKVTVTQGVAVRVSAADAQALCDASAGGAPASGPAMTQRRIRTYWYVHGDQ